MISYVILNYYIDPKLILYTYYFYVIQITQN